MVEKTKKGSRRSEDEPVPAAEEPVQEPETKEKLTLSGKLQKMQKKNKCCKNLLKIIFIGVAILTLFKSIALMIVSVVTAITTRAYTEEQSGRLVALIILTVTAAVALAITSYALVAVFTKKAKPIHAASVVLLVLAFIQTIILGASVRVTDADQQTLSDSLVESFKLARDHSPRHAKIWAATQNDLNCCGVYGPNDYRLRNVPIFFPPDVPISCCTSYDSKRSDLVQEREREVCKQRKSYYNNGCKQYILDAFVATGKFAVSVTIALIILEVILSVIGFNLPITKSNRADKEKEKDKEDPEAK